MTTGLPRAVSRVATTSVDADSDPITSNLIDSGRRQLGGREGSRKHRLHLRPRWPLEGAPSEARTSGPAGVMPTTVASTKLPPTSTTTNRSGSSSESRQWARAAADPSFTRRDGSRPAERAASATDLLCSSWSQAGTAITVGPSRPSTLRARDARTETILSWSRPLPTTTESSAPSNSGPLGVSEGDETSRAAQGYPDHQPRAPRCLRLPYSVVERVRAGPECISL